MFDWVLNTTLRLQMKSFYVFQQSLRFTNLWGGCIDFSNIAHDIIKVFSVVFFAILCENVHECLKENFGK